MIVNKIEYTLSRIVETGIPESVKGKMVDTFTATMILTVSRKLNEDNRKELFSRSINEIVAISYKVLTH